MAQNPRIADTQQLEFDGRRRVGPDDGPPVGPKANMKYTVTGDGKTYGFLRLGREGPLPTLLPGSAERAHRNWDNRQPRKRPVS